MIVKTVAPCAPSLNLVLVHMGFCSLIVIAGVPITFQGDHLPWKTWKMSDLKNFPRKSYTFILFPPGKIRFFLCILTISVIFLLADALA